MRSPDSIKQKKENAKKRKKIGWLSLFFIQYFNKIAVLIAILVFILGINFIILPKYREISQEIKYSNKDKADIKAGQERYLKKLLEYRNSYEKISLVDRNRINTALPDKGEKLEDLYLYFKEFAINHGMVVSSFLITVEEDENPQTEQEKKGKSKTPSPVAEDGEDEEKLPDEINEVNISFSLEEVNYQELKDLLKDIEEDLRIMDVNSLSFDVAARTVSLDVSFYYMTEDPKGT